MIQFDSSEEPPYAMNGRVRPVSGIRRVTPPTTTIRKTSAAVANSHTATARLRSGFPKRFIRRPTLTRICCRA